MSLDTDLKARLESLRINIEWLDQPAGDRPAGVITISSFSRRLLEYGAFLIFSNAHAEPENQSVETTGGGYCLHYRQTPEAALSRMLCRDLAGDDSTAELKLLLTEERG